MYSVSETIENGNMLCTASPTLWVVKHILYWPPPGENVDRSVICSPGPDWIPHMCRVLRENIGKLMISFICANLRDYETTLKFNRYLCKEIH